MSRLMIGISGVRGVVGENLTPALLVNLGQAFGTWVDGGLVVVGRDTRVTGEMVKHAVFAGLLAAGCRIVDAGVVGTPTAAMSIRRLGAHGGVVISASHNPIEWNALKFFRADGIYLNEAEGRELLDIYYGGDMRKVGHDRIHAVRSVDEAVEFHLRRVLERVDVPALRRRGFTVALDCCNGAGSDIALRFLEAIGAKSHAIHCAMDGRFPRPPEPKPDNIIELRGLVRRHRADAGFAQDADADRLAIVSEKGVYIGEEYSLCLAARLLLSRAPGRLVTNLSTTRMVDDVAARHNSEVIRTPVGEVNVATAMLRTGAVIGGEGNGGVIDPQVHMGRDALAGMALTLQLMLETGKTITQLAAEIPTYHISKQKIDGSKMQVAPALEALAHEDALAVDTQDGVKLDFAEGWVHVRPSNTEPIVRVYAEARTRAGANALATRYRRWVQKRLAAPRGGPDKPRRRPASAGALSAALSGAAPPEGGPPRLPPGHKKGA